MRHLKTMACAALALAVLVASASADVSGLKTGSPGLKSAGPIAFGPEGVLLVGDTKAATVVAIDTGDTSGDPSKVKLHVNGLDGKVAKALGAGKAQIKDLAVNPLSGNVYLSVNAGGKAAIVRVDAKGNITPLNLKKVRYSKATLPDPPEDKAVGSGRRKRNYRDSSITDLAFVEGQIIVSGTSLIDGKPASTVRALSFPPSAADQGTQLEIYHGAHGKYENSRAANTIVPLKIGGELNILAAYTCTPLVKFPVSSLVKSKGKQVRGTTVAELGNHNQPLDMISYEKGGKTYLLIINSARGVMKVSTSDIGRKEGISSPIKGGKTAGQKYETIQSLKGVVQLDKLSDSTAVILVQADGQQNLQTISLP